MAVVELPLSKDTCLPVQWLAAPGGCKPLRVTLGSRDAGLLSVCLSHRRPEVKFIK